MDKKGFTLAELLAVVAILAILILVAVPTFSKYVLNSETKYYNTLEKSVRTAGMEYFSENAMFLPNKIGTYSVVDKQSLKNSGILESVTDSKGNDCETVKVIVRKKENGSYEYESCLKCGSYKTNSNICSDNFDLDGDGSDKTGPSVADIYVSKKTTNSIIVNAVCKDEESGIKKYWYSSDGGRSYLDGGQSTSYKFDRLTSNRSYDFRVKCVGGNNLERESNIVTAVTASFTNPSFAQVKPAGETYPLSGYSHSPRRHIQITYNNYNIESEDVVYYLKSSVDVTTRSNVYECSSDANGKVIQNSCSSTASQSMSKDKWYRSGNIEVISTFSTSTETSNHYLYAAIGDGLNISSTSSYTVTKIDTVTPTITIYSDPKTLNNTENYKFTSNARASYGYSSGSMTCIETTTKKSYSLKKGTYTVRCTAVGNNGLRDTDSYEVKHSYPATYVEKTCTKKVNCKSVKICVENYACDPWDCSDCWGDLVCSAGCGKQYFGSTCCKRYESGTKCDTKKYDCSYYECPNGGTVNGDTCYY